MGTLAERPAVGKLDRAALYFATDTVAVYFYDPTAQVWTLFSGGGGTGYATIEEETVPLTQRNVLNFTGVGITAADDNPNTRTNVTLGTIDTLAGTITEAQHGSKSTSSDHAVMGASGASHAPGFTPDTPAGAGSTKFLREDKAWAVPAGASPAQLGIYTYVIGPSITTPGSYSAWLFGSGTELFTNVNGTAVLQACNDALKAAGASSGLGNSIGVQGILGCTSKFTWDCPAMSISGTGWLKEKGVPPIEAPCKISYDGGILHDSFVQQKARDPQLLNVMIDGNGNADQTLRIGNGDNSANRSILENCAIANGGVTTLWWESGDGEWVEGECRSDPGSGGSAFRTTLQADGGNLNFANVHFHGMGAGVNGRVIVNAGQANAWANCHAESGTGSDGIWLIENQSEKMTWTGGKWGYVEQAGHLWLNGSNAGITVAGVETLPQGLLNNNTYDQIRMENNTRLTIAGLHTFLNAGTPNPGPGPGSSDPNPAPSGAGRGEAVWRYFLSRGASVDAAVLSACHPYAYRAWDFAPTSYAACVLTHPNGANSVEYLVL
jgi:hypothetical protein